MSEIPIKRPNDRLRAVQTDRYSFTRLVLSETFVSQNAASRLREFETRMIELKS